MCERLTFYSNQDKLKCNILRTYILNWIDFDISTF